MVGIQDTSRGNIQSRVRKILKAEECDPDTWLNSFGRPGLLVVGWGVLRDGEFHSRIFRIAGTGDDKKVVMEWDGSGHEPMKRALEHCQTKFV